MRIRILRASTRALWSLLAPIRSFLSRRQRIASFVQRLLDRFPRLQNALLELARDDPQERYERWIAAYDTLDDADLSVMRDELSRLAEPPLLSILVPVIDANEAMLEALAHSLRAQVYDRWEVEFLGMPAADDGVTTFLTQAPSREPRFRPPRDRAASFADAWSAALRSAASDFVVLVDPRVSLRPHALFLFARTIVRHPDAMLIYADEDSIDETGARYNHYFKPDWNLALLRSQNYLGGLVGFRGSLAPAVGGCHEELDGDCAWCLFLRMTAEAPPATIHHLPYILSHRPSGPRSLEPDDPERRKRVARAVERRFACAGDRIQVEPVGEASYRTRYALPEKPPAVSVIVPSTCKLDLLRPCMDGLLNRTSYPELEVLLVVNGIRKILPKQREYLDAVAAQPQVRVLFYDERPYNFSRTNNWAAEHARGELLCFVNDDTEVIGRDWLAAMVGQVLQDRVGAVGAKLFYPNDRIQHAGLVLGAGGVADHTYRGRPRRSQGYHDRALVDQDVSGVTAACMLVRRQAFWDVGCFDPKLAIAFNDVDLCLRLRDAGWRIVWTPGAELYHKESASIGRHDVADRGQWTFEWELIHSRWGDQLSSDPHYSPNLSLDQLYLWEPAFPPRVSYPWRAGLASPATSV